VRLLLRVTGDPASYGGGIRRELQAMDPTLPLLATTTLRQTMSIVLLPQRVAAGATGVLGLFGLLLTAVGLYGVLSFSAAQRSREIGVRVALGATRGDVLRLIVGEGMRLVGAGMAGGLVLAILATRALRPFLLGVSPVDPLTFLVIAGTLGTAALLASYLPARRAATVDPATTLRRD
jgi:ABC-type antimicrobial peptide transport system permease subunit